MTTPSETAEQSASLSFEIFPPKTQMGGEKILTTLKELQNLNPSFISVTCSNTKGSFTENTVKLAEYINSQLELPTVAHLPAAYLSQAEVQQVLKNLAERNIFHLLALRGDILPEVPITGDFQYASDLIAFIKSVDERFVISGACYPEVHPDSPNRVADIKHLKTKTEAGCSELVTQLFFDNEVFYEFKERCLLADIDVPILAGIMPIVNRSQALRLIKTSSAKLPKKFLAILEKYEHNPIALRDAGLAYAVDQIVDLVTQDVAGIHLYTMNHGETAKKIYQATASLFQTEQLTA